MTLIHGAGKLAVNVCKFTASVPATGLETLVILLVATSTTPAPVGLSVIFPLVELMVLPFTLMLSTCKLVNVPTLVKLELTILEPNVVLVKTSTPLILKVLPNVTLKF